jgi:hypothetical protein
LICFLYRLSAMRLGLLNLFKCFATGLVATV